MPWNGIREYIIFDISADYFMELGTYYKHIIPKTKNKMPKN